MKMKDLVGLNFSADAWKKVQGNAEDQIDGMQKMCVLEDGKICNQCGECNMCDLDPNKVCDNCMKCVKSNAEYNAIEIDEIIMNEDEKNED